MSKIFCERVRQIIQIRGRTNQEVADAIGVDRKIVIRLKNDPCYVPRVDVVANLADDMGVPMAWLLGRDEEAKVMVMEKTEVIKEIVEVPVETVKEVRRKFFNPKWEEATEDEANPV